MVLVAYPGSGGIRTVPDMIISSMAPVVSSTLLYRPLATYLLGSF